MEKFQATRGINSFYDDGYNVRLPNGSRVFVPADLAKSADDASRAVQANWERGLYGNEVKSCQQ